MADYDVNALKLVLAVAKHSSFRRAAADLGMSASNLSERIRTLEEQIGVRILNRTTRSVALTEAGRVLLSTVSGPLADIEVAVAVAAGTTGTLTGRLRINGPEPAVEFRLMPILIPFAKLHRDLQIEVVADSSLADIVGEGFDAGVRYGEAVAKDMITLALGGPQRMVVVGSPAYLNEHGRPQRPADLADHRCFAHLFPRHNALGWFFEKDAEQVDVRPQGPFATNSVVAQVTAATEGIGLAFLFEDHVRSQLSSGALETVLDDWTPPFGAPRLYFPERRLMPPALRAFVDHVRRSARS